MEAARVDLPVPGSELRLPVVRYGHWGRPVLAFPSENGDEQEWAAHGMVDAVRGLVDGGRVSLFCVGTLDAGTWGDRSRSTEERAQRYGAYTAWLTEQALPWISEQVGASAPPPLAVGVSLGGYHAVQLTLTRADLVPLAIGLSGSYEVTAWHGWGPTGSATYFADPPAYVPGLDGEHLDWLRRHASVLLVVGQGRFEESPTHALSSTRQLAAALQDKGIPCELDVWGGDVEHDWPWWQRQLAYHLPRFC